MFAFFLQICWKIKDETIAKISYLFTLVETLMAGIPKFLLQMDNLMAKWISIRPLWQSGCQWCSISYNSSTNNLNRESPALWTKCFWKVQTYCSQKSLMLKIKSESFLCSWLGTLKKVRSMTWHIWKRRRWSFARASMDGRGKSSNSLKMKMLTRTDINIKSLVEA